MAENTEISWTDNTHNHWEGCTKVGPGCDNCYAEARNNRFSAGVNWGPGAPRRLTSVHNRNLPLRWNARPFYECTGCGWRGEKTKQGFEICATKDCFGMEFKPARRRVFCSSLADVFDNEVDPQWRADLFALIHATPNLDWLLLTKRIGNAMRMMLDAGLKEVPGNVWLGATIVNQEEADRDIPKLLAVPARVRFLSMEPLLGAVDINQHLVCLACRDSDGKLRRKFDFARGDPDECAYCGHDQWGGIDWVIVGGESGKEARPMRLDWVTSLRDQCAAEGVAFHLKQWGEWAPGIGLGPATLYLDRLGQPIDPEGKGPVDRLFCAVHRAGKKAAGRELDGRTHNEFPRVTP